MKKTMKILITLSVIVFLWISLTASTSEVVAIKEVSSNEMVIETMTKEIKTIKVRSNLANIIDENRKYHDSYHIKYRKNIWGKPKLLEIEPMKDNNR
ncbi:hypothetical protein [Saccharibacillus kuerlensis]|uniref:Uncharacterized protein n=1 Tax=Saccharibacillus kuerlensis TaxID=459527 RepID=A0ABQ2L4X8_9BACL|nr:hypothetical protein [Saccharibacillus kuerlensis]GGO03562.1 hypothetical protein GCM10010969_27890 [Saccharibacillus kuerlensis]